MRNANLGQRETFRNLDSTYTLRLFPTILHVCRFFVVFFFNLVPFLSVVISSHLRCHLIKMIYQIKHTC